MKRAILFFLFVYMVMGQKIQQVSLKPAKITQKTDIMAVVVPAAAPEGYRYIYTWFVNGKPIHISSPLLPSSYFKKGDFVWVAIKLVEKATGKTVDYAESLRVKVLNLPPDIISSPPSAKGLKPGDTYEYPIVVKDEDDPPDSIEIKLVKAPEGAILDGNTLKWKLPKKAGKFPFVIEARDPYGGKCTISFEISIGKKKVSPQETE